ncbi:MAG: hypothetical protein AB7U79_08425 [Candidatus Izemoplasmatales bacterium]
MFQKEYMGVFDWFAFWILMLIPVVNIVVILMILFSSNSNDTLRNMLFAEITLAILVVILFSTSLQPYLREVWGFVSEQFPMNQFF